MTDSDLDPLAAFRIDGKVAIVTGASSGLGARFARVLSAAGAKVVLVARRRERLEELAGELDDALSVPADLSVLDAVGNVVERALKRYGRVDVLVNNAGMVDVHPAEEEPLDEFRKVIDVNLVAPFALSQHAARAMLNGEEVARSSTSPRSWAWSGSDRSRRPGMPRPREGSST